MTTSKQNLTTINDLNKTERAETLNLLINWLKDYTDEVIKFVLPKIDEIINNDAVMFMLKTLLEEEEKDDKHFKFNLDFALLGDTIDNFQNRFSNASKYRHVLYELYIKGYSNSK